MAKAGTLERKDDESSAFAVVLEGDDSRPYGKYKLGANTFKLVDRHSLALRLFTTTALSTIFGVFVTMFFSQLFAFKELRNLRKVLSRNAPEAAASPLKLDEAAAVTAAVAAVQSPATAAPAEPAVQSSAPPSEDDARKEASKDTPAAAEDSPKPQ